MPSYSLNKDKIKVLLLDNVHAKAVELFRQDGYTNIELFPRGLFEDELFSVISDVYILGLRSATKISEKVLKKAEKLICIGRFGVGVNNIDVHSAKLQGIPVFNAPFANSRSVAELTVAHILSLFRGIHEKNLAAHEGRWLKSPKNAHEIRGKHLGIIGYSNIGTQVGLMAEALGMRVFYYDVEDKMPLGNAVQLKRLQDLLLDVDVISVHVPGNKHTKNLISFGEIALMKKGSFLVNTSRGSVVNEEALVKALEDKHLFGAALDVFVNEPASRDEEFVSPFRRFPNVLLTPHVGGNTMEAQENIAMEVAQKMIKYSNNGSTMGAVNFAQVDLPVLEGKNRIIHVHRNVPGVLAAVNEVFSLSNINIAAQYLRTDEDIGYVVTDVDPGKSRSVLETLRNVKETIRTRVLY